MNRKCGIHSSIGGNLKSLVERNRRPSQTSRTAVDAIDSIVTSNLV